MDETATNKNVPSRERVWVKAWTAAMAKKIATTIYATTVADVCLREFDERFTQDKEHAN